MRVVRGNLFDTGLVVIAHSCNCQRVMGSGVAAQVKRLYPGAYKAYVKKIDELSPQGAFGKASIYVCPERIIMNIYGQFDYCRGWSSGINGGQFTNYEAFRSGLIDGISLIRDFAANSRFEKTKSFSIAIPYKIGCARGGADWGEVEAILCDIEEKCNVEFIAYKMEE